MTRRGKPQSTLSRVNRVVAAVRERTRKIIDQNGDKSKKFLRNCHCIDEICETFLRSLPTIDPTARSVSDKGKLLFAGFPAKSTLQNSADGYAELLRIWRDAYLELVTDVLPADFGTRRSSTRQGDRDLLSELELYLSIIKSQKIELDRLRFLAKASSPTPLLAAVDGCEFVQRKEHDIIGLQPVRKWIANLARPGGALEITDVGVQISRSGRPGRVIMESDVVNALRAL